MKIHNINVGFDNLDKILHVADIHIRNYQRHAEYKAVFKELYKGVDTLPENAIVYVAGDIVHNKTDISPELISLTSDFLKNLADRRHTIVITGNHDTNLNNTSRLDALTPIIQNLNHPKLHYLKDSGVYNIANVHFTVFSIFDPPSEFIKASSFDAPTKIALFHGPVQSSKTDIGYEVTGEEYTANLFDGYDLSLLGDIHKRQYVDKAKTICYPGSLIQQNFGEAFKHHGYAIWDVAKRTPIYIDISNKYGFYTIDVKDGILPNIDDIPKQPRLRIRTTNTTEAELKSIIKDIKKKCRANDIITIKQDKIKGVATTSRTLTRDVRDINYQNKLLQDYIEKNHDVDTTLMRQVKSINKTLNDSLLNENITRNVTWKMKSFEFSNMFSYGEGNTINFSKAKDVIGLFAPNHTGKSAILDSLAFCIFDRCSRGKSAADIMNNTKNTFHCKLELEIDGVDYFIERKAKRILKGWQKGKVRVDVDFWYIDEEGEKISLNGEQRRDTDKSIQSYLGEYDDFILTALSVQNNNTGFIDKSQFEKKDLLSQFLDITVFEQLYALANEEIRDVQALLKDFGNTDYSQDIIDKENELEKSELQYKILQQEKDQVELDIKVCSKEILDLTKSLHKKIPLDNLDELERETRSNELKIHDIDNRLQSDEDIAKQNKQAVIKSEQIVSQYESSDLEDRYDEYKTCSRKLQSLHQTKEMLKKDVLHKQEKLDAIGQFDPNCSFCKNNDFVKTAHETRDSLEQDKVKARELIASITECKAQLDSYAGIEDDIINLNNQRNTLAKIQRERDAGRIAYYQAKEVRDKIITRNIELQVLIDKYHSNVQAIEENKSINNEITLKEQEQESLKHLLSTIDDKRQLCYSDINVYKTDIKSIHNHIEKAHSLEIKLKAYEYYLDAIKRDGIPYEIISDTLPYIQEEVNNILSQVVDFELEFDVDGKNILTYIKYNNQTWSLEMTSGMEKFISSLAIRVALINISNLPRPTFLAIDEGFGNLDANNINSMSMLFDYLKTEFDFILIISHIDVMRDMVDDAIEISKQHSLSNVIY